MFFLNGKALAVDTPFTVEETQYPSNWLRLASAEEKAALGITEVPDQVRPDDRFFWVTENPDGTFTALPKALDTLKTHLVSQVKTTAGSLLSVSDWKVIRAAEGTKPVDAETLAYRASVRSYSNMNEAAILAAQDVDELQKVAIKWPEVS